LDDDVRVQTADATGLALIDSWHPDNVDRVKADEKVTETSKLMLKEVIALSCTVYCPEVERAVLGETVEEVTVKLTCAFSSIIQLQAHIHK
jgi:hypothetical protein